MHDGNEQTLGERAQPSLRHALRPATAPLPTKLVLAPANRASSQMKTAICPTNRAEMCEPKRCSPVPWGSFLYDISFANRLLPCFAHFAGGRFPVRSRSASAEKCIVHPVRQILLLNIAARVVVRIQISFSMTEAGSPFVCGVAQMDRNRLCGRLSESSLAPD